MPTTFITTITTTTTAVLDPKTIRVTMSVIGYLGTNEFYRKVDKIIQADPTIPYETALWSVVNATNNSINAIKETL
jgi:hypothetical protein